MAAAVKATTATTGAYAWTVSSPQSAAVLVRVTWTGGSAKDASDAPFTIAPPYISLSAPASTSNWGFGSKQRVRWKTNLGPSDMVTLAVSTDGGASFPFAVASGVSATALYADVVTPALGAAAPGARVRVKWSNPPSGLSASASTSSSFTIAPPYIRVTSPNGGEAWTSGASHTVTWTCNLGGLEPVRIDVSIDGGATWPIAVTPGTPCDGSHSIIPATSWRTSNAKLKVTWTTRSNVADVSNAAFTIQ
jgi:hypothetical protein